jgi:signal transduction histidine kinase
MMAGDPSSVQGAVKGMSLERKLPLLMTGVLLVILASGVLVMERETRRAAEVVNRSRLQEVSGSIAQLVVAVRPGMLARLHIAADNPAILRSLRAGRVAGGDRAAVADALTDLRVAEDSGFVSELWNAEGNVIASVGDRERHSAPTGAVATASDSLSIGSFYEFGGRIYYWSSIPVLSDAHRIGTMAQRRRLNNNPATERNIARLSQQDARILFHNADGGLWTTFGGSKVDPPSNPHQVRELTTYDHPEVTPGDRVVIAETKVTGMPWVVALEVPVRSLKAGPRDLLDRFALMSLLLLILGAIAVWIISRRITSPLARMTAAAEAMAHGDYSQRVLEDGDHEIARLGSSFNRMAAQVETAQQNLREAADTAAGAKVIAEEANAAKANFLAAVSHELRTPLNAIAGYVDLLEMGLRGPVTEEQLNDLSRIRRSQQYLLGLIEQILVFTQLDAHQVAIHLQDVSVDELMRDAQTMVEPQMRSRGIEYSYVADSSAFVIRADREKTQQIILNLLANGAKYTNPGGRVTTYCESRNGSVHVKVADTGAGIPERLLEHIFEPFVQLDRRLNQPREGVGLGLTISRDLARAMGGDLFAESTVGVGSTFTLVLPRADGSEQHAKV